MPQAPAQLATTRAARFAGVDNLRTLVIVLVVFMHSNVTYSGFGGWYYIEGDSDSLDIASTIVFGYYGSVTQAWFMGCMFMVAAIFSARSLASRGSAAFVRERLVRLGVPLLLYVFVVTPFIAYWLIDYEQWREHYSPLEAYAAYLRSWEWIGATGPLWFAEALIAFCLVYAGVRAWRPAAGPGRPLTERSMVVAIVVVAVAAFALRLVFPLGTDVANLQFGFFASYMALFWFGIRIGESHSLDDVVNRLGAVWFARALTWGSLVWGALMGTLLINDAIDATSGGFSIPAMAFAAWESFVAIGLSIGMLSLAGRRLTAEGKVARFLAANSFGVFVLHAPVLISISLALADWHAHPLLKHAVVAPLAVAASFAVAAAVRAIPPLGRVLR